MIAHVLNKIDVEDFLIMTLMMEEGKIDGVNTGFINRFLLCMKLREEADQSSVNLVNKMVFYSLKSFNVIMQLAD